MTSERKRIFRWMVGGFLLFLAIYFYLFVSDQFRAACGPLIVGVIMAYLMNIMLRFFERNDFLYNAKIIKSKRLHQGLCALLAVILLLAVLVFIFFFLGPQLTACVIALLDKVPSGIRFLINQPFLAHLVPPDTMETLRQIDWTDWINRLVSLVNSDDLFNSMTTTAGSALSVLSTFLFGVMFMTYFLAGRDRIRRNFRRLVRAFLPEARQQGFFHYTSLLNKCFHDFIVCQASQALIIGVSATVLMHLFRFPYASMIGTLNGFCALLPIVGGYIGAILGTLMILADAPHMALFFLIFIVVLQNAIGTLVFPRLVGQSLGLPPIWSLAAVTIGSGMAGIMGILIGVPLTAFVYKVVAEKLVQREKEKLLAGQAAPLPEEADGSGEKPSPGAPEKS